MREQLKRVQHGEGRTVEVFPVPRDDCIGPRGAGGFVKDRILEVGEIELQRPAFTCFFAARLPTVFAAR